MTARTPKRTPTRIQPRFDPTKLAVRILEHQVNKPQPAPVSPILTEDDSALFASMDFGDER